MAGAYRWRTGSGRRRGAAALRASVADTEPEFGDLASARLVDALSRAAGVPVVLKALEQDYIRGRLAIPDGSSPGGAGRSARAAQAPPAGPCRNTRRHTGGRDGYSCGAGTRPDRRPRRPRGPMSTSRRGRSAARRPRDCPSCGLGRSPRRLSRPGRICDELDRAIVGTPLRAPAPRWWQVFDVMRWLVAAVAVAGLLCVPRPGGRRVATVRAPRGVSRWGLCPTLRHARGGLLAGLLLTAAARVFSRAGARRPRWSRAGCGPRSPRWPNAGSSTRSLGAGAASAGS